MKLISINVVTTQARRLRQQENTMAHSKKATKNVINLYNEIRLHLSLDFKNT